MIVAVYWNQKVPNLAMSKNWQGKANETIILGANENNIDSALVPGGILANKLEVKYRQVPGASKMEEICAQYNIRPKFIIGGL